MGTRTLWPLTAEQPPPKQWAHDQFGSVEDLMKHRRHPTQAAKWAVTRGLVCTLTALPRRLASWAGRRGAGLPGVRYFVYDFHMREDQVSESAIADWVAEAEAGYDVEQLKRRGRGRPGRGAEPMQVVAVRLTADEIAALDAVAARDQVSRSEAIRRALAAFAA